MDLEHQRLLSQLEWSIILTLFAIAVLGLLGMAGVEGASEVLVRALTLNGALG